MLNNFSADYSERGDDELLQLASDRTSLTSEAAAALDAELARRNLTESDRAIHERFVKRNERREARRLRRRVVGSHRDPSKWIDLFWALLAIALIMFAYLALPTPYRLNPDREDAAVIVMFASVFIAVSSGLWWRKTTFWISLIISSTIHFFVAYAWLRRVGNSNNQGKLAVLLGFVLFFAVYGFASVLRRNFWGEEARR